MKLLDMTFEIDSDRACLLFRNLRIQAFLTMKEILKIQNGDKAVYKYLDFSEGVLKFVVRVSHGANSGKIETAHNNIQGSLIKTINVTGKGYLKTEQARVCSISIVSGRRAIRFRFIGDAEYIFHFNSFHFEK